MLFCLRTLVPQIPDLRILDLTIGYPGVPRGGYAQEWCVCRLAAIIMSSANLVDTDSWGFGLALELGV
jgi:hypothetical protein